MPQRSIWKEAVFSELAVPWRRPALRSQSSFLPLHLKINLNQYNLTQTQNTLCPYSNTQQPLSTTILFRIPDFLTYLFKSLRPVLLCPLNLSLLPILTTPVSMMMNSLKSNSMILPKLKGFGTTVFKLTMKLFLHLHAAVTTDQSDLVLPFLKNWSKTYL